MELMQLLEREIPSTLEVITEPMPSADIVDPMQRELALKAKETLGYEGMLQEIRKVDAQQRWAVHEAATARTKRALQIKAREVLHELDIQPYSKQSVNAYKVAAVDKAEGMTWEPAMERIPWSNKAADIAGTAFAVSFFGLIAGVVLAFFQAKMAGLVFGVAGAAFLASIIVSIAYEWIRRPREKEVRVQIRKSSSRYVWREVPLAQFREVVPEFSIDTAVRIKERLQEAEFYVDAMQRQSDHRYDDPFLVLVVGGEKHYIEVWDEPDFEVRVR